MARNQTEGRPEDRSCFLDKDYKPCLLLSLCKNNFHVLCHRSTIRWRYPGCRSCTVHNPSKSTKSLRCYFVRR